MPAMYRLQVHSPLSTIPEAVANDRTGDLNLVALRESPKDPVNDTAYTSTPNHY